MGPAQEQSGIADALAQALQVVKEGQQAQEESAGQEVEVKGAGGQILVTATLAGKLNVRIVDPRAFRLGVEELSEAITTTVNAALDAAREQAGLPGDVDLSELSGKLEEIQQQSVQRLQSFMSGLVETQAQVVRAAAEGQRR